MFTAGDWAQDKRVFYSTDPQVKECSGRGITVKELLPLHWMMWGCVVPVCPFVSLTHTCTSVLAQPSIVIDVDQEHYTYATYGADVADDSVRLL